MDAADPSEAGEEFDDVTAFACEAPHADRSHNRDTLSSEAMTEMLRDIQDAMLALDERLGALEAAQGHAKHDTSRLARGVADMGEALTRRVRALEHGKQDPPPILTLRAPPIAPVKPPRPRPQNRLAWIAGLVFVLAIVLGTFWLLNAEIVDHASLTAEPKPVVTMPPPAVAVTIPIAPPVPVHIASQTVTAHRSTPAPGANAHPASNSALPPTGYGHYGPATSTTSPGPTRP